MAKPGMQKRYAIAYPILGIFPRKEDICMSIFATRFIDLLIA
jgi:hypothetical protein